MDLNFNLRAAGSDAGQNVAPMGDRGPTDYHPTVAFLLIMVIAELALFVLLRVGFRHSHGG